MALSTELYGLKSAGTYRFEKDQSVTLTTVEPLNNIRMLVGFSKKGPFNTPVMITTTKEFIDTFGDIDRSLEKRGAYFHRSCLAALSAGPIYALNLLKLTNEDNVDVVQFSTSATCSAQTQNPAENVFSYKGMYNIDTFYTPSEESFLHTIGRSNFYRFSTVNPDAEKSDGTSTNDILNFTNIGKSPVSVIVTKASEYNSSGFQITAQEWYGKGNVPAYLHDTSYISDFMVDVYVISGNWGGDFSEAEPYERFASDIKFSKYFDRSKGLKRRKNAGDTTDTLFMQFLNEPDVKLIGKYTGCLIPGFVDKKGRNMYIEYMVNSDTAVNGLMCAVNEQIFDESVLIDGDRNGIDIIGNSLYDAIENEGFSNINFLSYSGVVTGSIETPIDLWNVMTSGSTGSDPDGFTLDTTALNVAEHTFNGTSTGSDQAEIGIVEYTTSNSDNTVFTKYVYYYDEEYSDPDDTTSPKVYVAPDENGVTDDSQRAYNWGVIYDEISNGKKVYLPTPDGLLVPITSITKTYMTVPVENKIKDADVRQAVQDELDAKYLDSNNAIKYTNSLINAYPIIKYEVVLKSDSSLSVTGSDASSAFDDEYVLASDFDGYNAAFNNEDGKTAAIMFLEGSDVYNNRSSLGTNDKVSISTSDDNPEHAVDYDINWTDDANQIEHIIINGTTYDIANMSYAPDYVCAMFQNKASAVPQTYLDCDVISDTYWTFVNGNAVEDEESGEPSAFAVSLGTKNVETTVNVLKSANGTVAQPNQFIIPVNSTDPAYECVKVGNYALSNYCDEHRLTRIVNITGIANSQGIVDYRLVTCQDNVAIETINFDIISNESLYTLEVFSCLTDWFTNYNVFTLNGFNMKPSHMPNGTNERQHEILDLLSEESEYTNLFSALIDRELIQFRYLVDTFGLGIEEMCKKQYTNLCKNRKSAFAIINMPSVNDFKNSEDPSFLDKNMAVSAEYIAKGANPNTNPSFLFSLPDKVNGSTWGAYYYPYLKVYSNYTTINVPPAAYISNNYVAKYGSGMPWTVVAGQNRGVISGNNVVGVETSLVRDNRDWLEPAGINSIIYENGVGCVIYANKTAQQNPVTALSSINCREVCIYIQDNIEDILRSYLFESNTPQTRLEIKTLVDNFLDMVKSNFGVYDFRTIMDTSNNTVELIDKNMGVIDVYIEPIKNLEILVQTLTILKTGAIESGTFE